MASAIIYSLTDLQQMCPLQLFGVVLQHHTDSWWCNVFACEQSHTDGLQRAVRCLMKLVHPDKHGSLNAAGILLATQATQALLSLKERLCVSDGVSDVNNSDLTEEEKQQQEARAHKTADRASARMVEYQRDIDMMRDFVPDTVAYYLALAALPAYGSCDLGHALYTAYLSVNQKRKVLDELLLALRVDPSDKDLTDKFTLWLQRVRSEGRCWNQMAAPFRRMEQPQSLGRSCSAYNKEFVRSRALFEDHPDWNAMEQQLLLSAPPETLQAPSVACGSLRLKLARDGEMRCVKRARLVNACANSAGGSRATAIELD